MAHVPNLCRIVALMGGFERLSDGESYVLTDHRGYGPNDNAPLEEIFPRRGASGHAFYPLHVTRACSEGDALTVHVSLDFEECGDVCHDSFYTFKTTLSGWREAQWECVSFIGLYGTVHNAEDERAARELNELASQLDETALAIGSRIETAERYGSQSA